MLTLQQARELAVAYLQEMDHSGRNPHASVVIDSATECFDFGWVFHYQSREFLETGNFSFAYGGNAPLLVDRHTGLVHVTGTCHPVEHFISNYRFTGDPHREPVWHLEFKAQPPSPDVPASVRLFRDRLGLPLSEAKRTVDTLLAGSKCQFEIGTWVDAEDVRRCFADVGFLSEAIPK